MFHDPGDESDIVENESGAEDQKKSESEQPTPGEETPQGETKPESDGDVAPDPAESKGDEPAEEPEIGMAQRLADMGLIPNSEPKPDPGQNGSADERIADLTRQLKERDAELGKTRTVASQKPVDLDIETMVNEIPIPDDVDEDVYRDVMRNTLTAAAKMAEKRNGEYQQKVDALQGHKDAADFEAGDAKTRELIGADRWDDEAHRKELTTIANVFVDSGGLGTPAGIAVLDAAHKTISGAEFKRGVAEGLKLATEQARGGSDGSTSDLDSSETVNFDGMNHEQYAAWKRDNPPV